MTKVKLAINLKGLEMFVKCESQDEFQAFLAAWEATIAQMIRESKERVEQPVERALHDLEEKQRREKA